MRDIIISVNRDKKEINNFEKKKISKIKKKEECDFCGVDITNDLNLHPDENDLYASCSMCYYSENLDKIISMDKGSMILMPEINQQTLNNIIRFIWLLELSEEEKYFEKLDTLMGLFEQIKEREYFVESYYCEGAKDVDKIINALHNLSIEKYRKREIGLDGLLWLPNKDFFEEKINDWRGDFLHKYNFDSFEEIIKEVKDKVNG